MPNVNFNVFRQALKYARYPLLYPSMQGVWDGTFSRLNEPTECGAVNAYAFRHHNTRSSS